MGAGRGGRGGTVVQTSSVAGVLAGALGAARHGHVEHVYTAAKSGLIGLTRCDKLSPPHLKLVHLSMSKCCLKLSCLQRSLKRSLVKNTVWSVEPSIVQCTPKSKRERKFSALCVGCQRSGQCSVHGLGRGQGAGDGCLPGRRGHRHDQGVSQGAYHDMSSYINFIMS